MPMQPNMCLFRTTASNSIKTFHSCLPGEWIYKIILSSFFAIHKLAIWTGGITFLQRSMMSKFHRQPHLR